MNIIDPSTIDLLALPSVPLEQRAKLPTTPCVYLAIDHKEIVQYIGISNNPKKRWQAHHRGVDLALLGGIRIAYLECDANLLPEIERALITHFCPPLNQLSIKASSRIESKIYQRRYKGDGSARRLRGKLPPQSSLGCIYRRTKTINGVNYQEAWYHYEFWLNGNRLTKTSRYIPKRLVAKIQELESIKAPVAEILKLLGVD